MEGQHLVWNNHCKWCCVGRKICSEICLYLDISNTVFEFFFLLADIEREKMVKFLIVARRYVGMGYQFIHTKEFNSKQGCITIHPIKFKTFVWGTINYNHPQGIDLMLAFFKFTRLKMCGFLVSSPSLSVWNPTIINLGFSGAVFTLSRHVKLVDAGTDNISHCFVQYATDSLTLYSIAL